jgi:hypothetical protein
MPAVQVKSPEEGSLSLQGNKLKTSRQLRSITPCRCYAYCLLCCSSIFKL